MSRRPYPAVLLAFAAACAVNPVTGKSQLSLMSEDQEIAMGRQAAAEVRQSIGYYDDSAAQAYVARIGHELAARSERPNLPWDFHIVNDASVNAFALPGGFIFVTRGLMTYLNNEAELATVLGHEIGHVTNRHSVTQMSRAQLAQLGLGIGSILSPTVAKLGQVAGAGLQVLFLKYSRDAESEADLAGFRYALADGYDVRQMANVFRTLDRVSAQAGGGRLPQWLETHPDPENRIQATEARLDTLHQSLAHARVNRAPYLRAVDGMVFGENPREGFFRGSLFLHPDLRFQIRFPDGWVGQNATQAVTAVSPQRDAVMQLALGQGTPEEAARQFFGQQGIQASNVGAGRVNGLPAVSGYFAAQTGQGPVAGMAAFVALDGTTYQITGYTSANSLGGYDGVFRQAIGSFARLTDPAALGVKPARVTLVRLPSAMTFADFNGRYPSAITLDAVAVVNEAEPDSRFPAGTLLKRIVSGGP